MTVEVGQIVTNEAVAKSLPIGTIVRTRQYPFRLTHTGWRNAEAPAEQVGTTLLVNGQITEIGDGPTYDPARSLNYREFMQRLRSMAHGSAIYSGVSLSPVTSAIQALNLPDMEPINGSRFHAADRDMRRILPDGAVVRVGHLYDPWRFQGVFRWSRTADDFRWLAGPNATIAGMEVWLHSGGSDPSTSEWLAPWGPDQENMVKALMQSAWLLGVKAKRANSWCGEYERAMSRVGITEAVCQTVITERRLRSLPTGSILRYVNDDDPTDRWILMRRADIDTGRGVEVIARGPNAGPRAKHGARQSLLWSPASGESMFVRPTGLREYERMPVGTVVSDRADSTNGYMLIAPDQWASVAKSGGAWPSVESQQGRRTYSSRSCFGTDDTARSYGYVEIPACP